MPDKPDRSQKTEKPTPKRLREAREKGQIARSTDLAVWVAMLATTVLVQTTITRGHRAFMKTAAGMGPAAADPDVGRSAAFFRQAIFDAMGVAAPMLVGLMVVGVVVQVSQVGIKPSHKRLKPEMSRLNVLKGLKRLFSMQAWWEVGKGLVKIGVLVGVAWPTVMAAANQLSGGGPLGYLVGTTAKHGLTMLRNVAAAGLVIGAADYVWQRRRVMRELSMTKQEVKEEMKMHEGNPQVRQALRSRQMAVSRNRMIQLVSNADVVVVNPTHYAVALKYEALKGAPEVLAKGAGVIAARIREEAEAHGVPIVHEPVLTRALFKACDLGDVIPIELYEAVAHLLAFVFALRAKGTATGYHEMDGRLAGV